MNQSQFKRLLFQTPTISCVVCKEPKGHQDFVAFNEQEYVQEAKPVYFCAVCSNSSLGNLAEAGLLLTSVETSRGEDGVSELTLRFADCRGLQHLRVLGVLGSQEVVGPYEEERV